MVAVEWIDKPSMDGCCPTQEETLAELERTAPNAPFLALGQTVFWDEPVKSLVALKSKELGYSRKFIAGVHDTDYFAKFKSNGLQRGYKALPHNDTTTKGLWSAAGEFSALFGSETIVTKESLLGAGAKLGRIQNQRPGYLDEITEAWGWRGVVSFDPMQRITAEKPTKLVFSELYDTFDWAIQTSLELIAGPHRSESELVADGLRQIACDVADEPSAKTLAGYYRALLPKMYDFAGSTPVDIDTTATTELLRFNKESVVSTRFDLPRLFLNPKTRELACRAYDESIAGAEMYPLDRFGIGALPFDLYIPGVGRGTLRLGTRGGVVMAPTPVGFSYKKAPASLEELAEILERRFGSDCVLVGKAVCLIGMLAREFVFVFHDGASSYVSRSRLMHQKLAAAGHKLELNPILRIRVEPWNSLTQCCAWFKLPPPLKRPFGVDELSGTSLSVRWKEVFTEQKKELARLKELRRPLDLIEHLNQSVGGQWNCLATQYRDFYSKLVELHSQVTQVKSQKAELVAHIKSLKFELQEIEKAKGQHWRDQIFEKSPLQSAWEQRAKFQEEIESKQAEIRLAKQEWQGLQSQQNSFVTSEDVKRIRLLRNNIAFEAELTRVRLIRDAIVASEGLAKAGHRPAAWWFPLVCPDGTWFRETARNAEFWLEQLN